MTATNPLDEIITRLDNATEFSPIPWRPVVNTAQVRFGVVDDTGCIVDATSHRKAEFLAHAPTDIAKLVRALRKVETIMDQLDVDRADGRIVMPSQIQQAVRDTIREALDG